MKPESRRLLCKPSRWMVTAAFRRKLAEGNSSPRISRMESESGSAIAKSLNRQSHKSPWRLAQCFCSLLLIISWQFSASAQAAPITPDGSASSLVTASSSIDSIDCIRSGDQEKQPSQDDNNFPDSTTDLDDTDGGLDDLSAGADTSTRNYQDTPLSSVTALDAVTLRTPRIVPILLFPVHCFYCLHKHTRERAPPIRGLTQK